MTKQPTLSDRLATVFTWCRKRSINQIYAFFYGCDNSLEEHEARMRYVLRKNEHIVTDTDLPWIESVELTMRLLDNRQDAA